MGSGIGPLRGVAQEILRARADYGDVLFVQGQREDSHFPYAAEHSAWRHSHIRLIKVTSRTGGSAEFQGYVQHALERLRPDTAHASAFLCGMREMVEAVSATLLALGLPRERLHLNY